ncbi:MAG: hypothetical protein M1814_001161 [Vezdaea aestivalis]|nr:MAG: hypothetical protein M1814_001161 [Vezdaea aestivalis]
MAAAGLKQLSYNVLDVFTAERFQGNPLAVVHVPDGCQIDKSEKQAIAKEFNLSETVFIVKSGKHHFQLDIFTIDSEIPFAGHPTIGAANLLLKSEDHDEKGEISLETRAGLIKAVLCRPHGEATDMAFVQVPHNAHAHNYQLHNSDVLGSGISHNIAHQVRGSSTIFSIVEGMTFALVELPSLDILSQAAGYVQVDNLKGNLDRPWYTPGSLIGTYYYVVKWEGSADKNNTVRISCRMFDGKIEDPATGSAGCALSVFLAKKLLWQGKSINENGSEKAQTRFVLEQGLDMGRRSTITVLVTLRKKDGEVLTVTLGGAAIKVMEGTLSI